MNVTLVKTLKKARTDRGFRLRDVASALDISPGYLSNIENDRLPTAPSEDLLRKFAAYFEIDVNRLFLLADILPGDSKQAVKEWMFEHDYKEDDLKEALVSYRKR